MPSSKHVNYCVSTPYVDTSLQGSHRSWKSWKVMEFVNSIFQALKSWEIIALLVSPWKVMEFVSGCLFY